jgi:tRNA1(Val) A37 N6-methylase TrmN6
MLKLGLDKDQEVDLEFCLSSPYSILANDMGTGKSAVAIAVKDRIKNSRCLIVEPSHLMLSWTF